MPDELWMQFHDNVQETGIQTIPKKKKCKKAKWLSEEALQIAEKRREVKGKGEREMYTLLNPEFQRITRRDNKLFFNEQCKEVEENNRKGKARELLKLIGDTSCKLVCVMLFMGCVMLCYVVMHYVADYKESRTPKN